MIVEKSQVITTTCMAAYNVPLLNYCYDLVIIDDAHAAQEPESLLAITLSKKHVILLGDVMQLGPTIKGDPDNASSIFSRLIEKGIVDSLELEEQYSLPPVIGSIASKAFYKKRVTNWISATQKYVKVVPEQKFPIMLIHNNVKRGEEHYMISEIVKKLVKGGVAENKISVICGNADQKIKIREVVKLNPSTIKEHSRRTNVYLQYKPLGVRYFELWANCRGQ